MTTAAATMRFVQALQGHGGNWGTEMGKPTVVDLFCGSGGVTLGLKNAGWDVLVGCDNDPAAGRSYRRNHPNTVLVAGDITLDSTVDAIHRGTLGRRVDMVAICAPCQPFSSKNAARGADPREQLIVRALAVVERLRPRLVLFENVVGLTTRSFRPVLDALRIELMRLGYAFGGPTIHDASEFGVAQARRRCLMLAARSQGSIDLFEAQRFDLPRKTVRDAIGDLAPLRSGEHDASDGMHRARVHRPIALERLRHIPPDGGSRDALPPHLVVDCHRRAGDSSFPDSYGRLYWDRPAPTLTGGCTDVTRGRYAHPDQDRALILREAARLQSFPDTYAFEGNGTEVAQQIGNAVPPAMVEVIGAALIEALALSPATEQCPVEEAHCWRDFQWLLLGISINAPSTYALRSAHGRNGPPQEQAGMLGGRAMPGRARPRDPPWSRWFSACLVH